MVATGANFVEALESQLEKVERNLERLYWNLSVLEEHVEKGRMQLNAETQERLSKIKERIGIN